MTTKTLKTNIKNLRALSLFEFPFPLISATIYNNLINLVLCYTCSNLKNSVIFGFYTLKNIGIDVLFICIHKIYLILCPFVYSSFHRKLTLLSIFLNVMLLQQKEDWTRLATSNGGFKALYTPAPFLEKHLFIIFQHCYISRRRLRAC